MKNKSNVTSLKKSRYRNKNLKKKSENEIIHFNMICKYCSIKRTYFIDGSRTCRTSERFLICRYDSIDLTGRI